MKTTKLFFMAALALMMTACSNDDNDIAQQPAKAEGIPFTATISVEKNATTRALEENGTTLDASWATGEKVALIYNVSATAYKTEATVTAQGDGSATISATLQSGATNGSDVTIIYPATAANGTTGNVKADLLSAQDGTLTGTGGTSIAEKYDVRKGTGKLSISGGTATVNNGTAGTPVTLTNQNAIFKLTLKNIDATADVSATSVKIYDVEDKLLTTVTPASGYDKVMYIALPTTLSKLKFAVTGSDSKQYFNMVSGLTLGANFYQSTLKLATIGNVIASNGKCYKDNAATPGGNTAVAMIAYLGSDTGETLRTPPYNLGLALALSDANNGNTRAWSTSNITVHTSYHAASSNFASESGLQYTVDNMYHSDTYPAFKAAIDYYYSKAYPTGCSSWFLPTGYQWNQMINACKNVLGTKNSYEDLRDGFSGVGGTNLQSNGYWSSTEKGNTEAWAYYFNGSDWKYMNKNQNFYVRSALAF